MEMPKRYSLWFMPSGNAYKTLNKIIVRLSRKYSTPKIFPHVTIIPDVVSNEEQIISDAIQLARLIKPFRVVLGKVGYSDEYFKCVFVRADPREILIAANSDAKRIFNRPDWTNEPHMTLLYGNLPDQTKKEIVQTIGQKLNVEFAAQSIHIIDSEPERREWHEIGNIQLQK